MGADRARRSFDPSRMYRSVVAQQGRVTLEADANEAEEIRAAESRAELLDLIGPTGTPDDGFKITVPAPGPADAVDFGIAAGTLYVGGMRIEQPAPTTYESQMPRQSLAGPAVPPVAGPVQFDELIYLMVTEHEVSAVEDHVLREVALGGPDTTGRTRLVSKVMRAPTTTTDCDEALANQLNGSLPGATFDARTMRLESTAQLKVDFVPVPHAADPCEPTAQPGFLGAENQLIRLQVTGSDGTSMLWGYDNASFLYRGVISRDQMSIELEGTPVDVFHQPRPLQWVEVLDIAVDLGGGDSVAAVSGLPYELADYDPSTSTIKVHGPVSQQPDAPVFVRMWENRADFTPGGATRTELKQPEGTSTGVVVLTTGTPLPGDYWMVGVRPGTPGDILPARLKDGFQSPDGPNRWATSLAIIRWSAPGVAQVHDCRRPFDDLVELTRAKCCELTVHPGDDVQRDIEVRLAANEKLGLHGLHVRFAAGRFDLDQPLTIKPHRTKPDDRADLTISGCGLPSEVVAAGQESAIIAADWDSTTVTDLTIRVADAREGGAGSALFGAFTVLNTQAALIERLVATSGVGPTRAACCVTIRNDDTPAFQIASARVRDCELQVEANQIGALLVNTPFATVEGNRVSRVGAPTQPMRIVRRTLISNVRFNKKDLIGPPAPRVDVLMFDGNLSFVTRRELEGWWREVITKWANAETTRSREGRRQMRQMIEAAVTQIIYEDAKGPLTSSEVKTFRSWVRRPPKVAASAGQGIVIGGAVATDIRVLNNTIVETMDGVHVGLSTQPSPAGRRDDRRRVRRLQITGNTIWHRVPTDEPPSRAAIFVGNVDRLTIRDNEVIGQADIAAEPPIMRRAEAIRVWGQPGGDDKSQFLLISGNVSSNEAIGIRIGQVHPSDVQRSLGVVTQNLAVDVERPIIAPSTIKPALDNVPVP